MKKQKLLNFKKECEKKTAEQAKEITKLESDLTECQNPSSNLKESLDLLQTCKGEVTKCQEATKECNSHNQELQSQFNELKDLIKPIYYYINNDLVG